MSRLAAASGCAALLLPACASLPSFESIDLEPVFARAGEERPAVAALLFDGGAQRLVVGDFRGGLEVVEWELDRSTPLPPAGGEVLALGWLGGEVVPVLRSGEPFAWGRLTGALATEDDVFAGWSALSRRLFASGARDARIEEVAVAAAAACGGRLYLLEGRPATRLTCRSPRSLDLVWSVDLERAARAVAADGRAARLLVGGAEGVEVRDLERGGLLARVAAPASALHPLRDGRRALLVDGEMLAVLRLSDPPRVGPGFRPHRGGITAVAVSPDGGAVATGGARGDLLVFRVLPAQDQGDEGASP